MRASADLLAVDVFMIEILANCDWLVDCENLLFYWNLNFVGIMQIDIIRDTPQQARGSAAPVSDAKHFHGSDSFKFAARAV